MMFRKMAAATILATLVLGANVGIAASVQNPADASFSTQLSEAKASLLVNTPAWIGRSERNVAEQHIRVAESLFSQGQSAKAQQYLNFARGKLGLSANVR